MQVVQQQWKECGLNLQIEAVEKLDYERLNMRGWSNPMYYPDPMGAMDTHWSNSSWTAQRGLWTPAAISPEWDATYEAARFATDPAERRAAYQRLLELSEEISGGLLLYKPHELYAMRDASASTSPWPSGPMCCRCAAVRSVWPTDPGSPPCPGGRRRPGRSARVTGIPWSGSSSSGFSGRLSPCSWC